MRYLLDTNTLSQAVKHPQGIIARRIRRAGSGKLATSVIVAAEMIYGGRKRGSSKLNARISQVLASVAILDFPAAAATSYAVIRMALESSGKTIGSNDQFIAAHAVHSGLTLVSDNVKEFQRVRGLKLENWLRE